MRTDWHEHIQRYANGQAGAEESAALQAALIEDAKLRALYLEYMNLDVALAAAAEATQITENGIDETADSHPRARPVQYGRWLGGAAAACVGLFVIGMLSRRSNPSPTPPDVAAACSRTRQAITRLFVEPPQVFPAWASPTDSMLDQQPILKMELPL
jgi:hypothetical protein